MSQPEAPPPDQSPSLQAPLILWRAVQALLNVLYNLFGAPEQLATRHTLTLKDHQLCAHWLRAAEALIRRMLFIEAALIAAERGPPGPLLFENATPKPRAPRQRQLIGFDADHPEAWRVSFRCFHGAPASRRHAPHSENPAPAGETPTVHVVPRFRSAWPLAERYEAMLRVVNIPAPHAKRLAARLRSNKALIARIAESSWEHFRDTVGHTLHDALTAPIANAAAVFRDSS